MPPARSSVSGVAGRAARRPRRTAIHKSSPPAQTSAQRGHGRLHDRRARVAADAAVEQRADQQQHRDADGGDARPRRCCGASAHARRASAAGSTDASASGSPDGARRTTASGRGSSPAPSNRVRRDAGARSVSQRVLGRRQRRRRRRRREDVLGRHGAEPRRLRRDDRPEVDEAQAERRRRDEERRRPRMRSFGNVGRRARPGARDVRLVVDGDGDLVRRASLARRASPTSRTAAGRRRCRRSGRVTAAGLPPTRADDPRDGAHHRVESLADLAFDACAAAASLAPNRHSSSAPPPIAMSAVATMPPASSRRQLTWRSRTSMEGTRQAEYRKGKLRRGGVAGPQSDAQTRRARRRRQLAARRGAVRRRIHARSSCSACRSSAASSWSCCCSAPTPTNCWPATCARSSRRSSPRCARTPGARRLLDRLHHRPARRIGADVRRQGRHGLAARRGRGAGRPASSGRRCSVRAVRRANIVAIEPFLAGCQRLWRRYVRLGACLLGVYGATAVALSRLRHRRLPPRRQLRRAARLDDCDGARVERADRLDHARQLLLPADADGRGDRGRQRAQRRAPRRALRAQHLPRDRRHLRRRAAARGDRDRSRRSSRPRASA